MSKERGRAFIEKHTEALGFPILLAGLTLINFTDERVQRVGGALFLTGIIWAVPAELIKEHLERGGEVQQSE